MATDYGTDINTFLPDGTMGLDPYFRQISGVDCPLQVVARRAATTPGGLISDPEFGEDILSLVNGSMDDTELSQAAARYEQNILLDERVQDAEVSITSDGEDLTAEVGVTLVDGKTFSLVLDISDVTLTVLRG